MPLEPPLSWSGFVIRDPSGKVRRKGAPGSAIDVSGLTRGRYQLGSPTNPGQTAELIISPGGPGGFYLLEQAGIGQLSVAFDPAAYSGPYRVTIQSSSRATQSYYAYGPVVRLDLGSGDWTVTFARPSEQGTAISLVMSDSGELAAANAVGVIKPVLFDFGSSWSDVTIRNDSGAIMRRGTDEASLDVTGLAEGHFTLSGVLGGLVRRQVLTMSNDIPGGAFTLEQQSPGGPITLTIANLVPGSVHRLAIYSSSGGPLQSFWVYGNRAEFTVPPGDWRISLAQPSTAGAVANIHVGANQDLESVAGLDLPLRRVLDLPAGWTGYYLLDPDGNVVRSRQGVSQADASGLPEGRYALKSGRSDATQFDLVISDRLPGGVASYEQLWLGGPVQLTLIGVTNSSPVLVALHSPTAGTRSSFYSYSNVVTLDVPTGEWTVQVARPSQAGLSMNLTVAANGELVSIDREPVSTDRRAALPAGWTGYVIADPAGTIVRQVNSASQLDFAGLPNGRYSMTPPGSPDSRLEVVISGDIPGEVVLLRPGNGGPAVLSFIDPFQSPFHVVNIYDGHQRPVSSYYIYGDEVSLDLVPGEYTISIGTPGGATFDTHVSLGNAGALLSVNGIATVNSSEWFVDVIRPADILGPITYNTGRAVFSTVGAMGAARVVQIRHDSTGEVSTYLAEGSEVALPLIDGAYSWRAFEMQAQVTSAAALDGYLAAQPGGWTRFEQRSTPLTSDYVLGLEPDRIEFPVQLRLSYPADSLRLDDGSILVANTGGANIYRYMSDGTLRRAVGTFSTGFNASGDGPLVALNQPSQMQRMADGNVWFVDYANHVIREYDPVTGQVRTLFGFPDGLEVVIVDGELQSVGDVFAIGLDDAGRPFLSVARAQALNGSHATRIIRQAGDGRWYDWPLETGTLGPEYRFTDVLFAGGTVWATVNTPDGTRRLLRYTAAGVLTGSMALGSQFGAGLVIDPESPAILVADHGNILSIDPVTMARTDYRMPVDLNNVASIEVYGTTLLITDSDAGEVLEYDTVTGRVVKSYGASSGVSNIYVDLHAVAGRLYALDNQTPRLVELRDNRFDVLVGTGEQQQAVLGVSADISPLRYPGAFTIGPDGTIYIVESNHRILAIGDDQIVRNFAGSLNSGYSGDGGAASQASFQSIYGLAVDRSGGLIVTDSYNHAIRAIGQDGIVRTLAGNGTSGISSNAFASTGSLNTPLRALPTSDARLFISDSWNNRVVELTSDNRLVNIAGTDAPSNYQGGGSFSGDGGLATEARLNTPIGLAYFSADRTLFIADSFNDRIRYVDSAGRIHTLIGGQRGFEAGTLLNLPQDVVLIGDDLYIADSGNGLVLKLTDVDRTGDDIASALHVSDASSRMGGFDRSEHVDATDADFYDVRGFGQSLVVRGEIDGLTVTLYAADGTTTESRILSVGERYQLAAGSAGFFGVSSAVHQGYSINLVQMGSQTAAGVAVDDRSIATGPELQQTLAIMRQDLASFAAGPGIEHLKWGECAGRLPEDLYASSCH